MVDSHNPANVNIGSLSEKLSELDKEIRENPEKLGPLERNVGVEELLSDVEIDFDVDFSIQDKK